MSKPRAPLSHRYHELLQAHEPLVEACGGNRDRNLFYNLNAAVELIRHTAKWDESDAVYRTFARRVDELVPVFARVPEELRRHVLYFVLCDRFAHAEAWLYRAGMRETRGADATEGWAPAYYDLVEKELGRNVVSAAVVDRVCPRIVQNLIDRAESVAGVDRAGNSALHHAVLQAKDDSEELAPVYLTMLLDAGAEPAVCNATGRTPLDVAVSRGYSQSIRALVVAGAVPGSDRHRRYVRRDAKDCSWHRALTRHKARWKEAEERDATRLAEFRIKFGLL